MFSSEKQLLSPWQHSFVPGKAQCIIERGIADLRLRTPGKSIHHCVKLIGLVTLLDTTG